MDHVANHPVRTTEKSLSLIEELRDRNGARIHELAAELDMTKGAIHNHLSTLREHGFVRKDGDVYRLSLQFLTLGGYVRSDYEIYEFGRPKADQLANDTGMLVNLMTEEGGRGVYLYQSRGEYAVNLDTHVGYRIHLHNIAVGKAILASLPEERVDAIVDQWGLPGFTDDTITTREGLFEELERVREVGVATNLAEYRPGVNVIAAPIFTEDDEVAGSIALSGPQQRLRSEWGEEELHDHLLAAANTIEVNLNFS